MLLAHMPVLSLLRALLCPPKPAQQMMPPDHTFWETAEVTNSLLYRFYDVPWVSVASSLYHLAYSEASGYRPLDIRWPSVTGRPHHYNARGHALAADAVIHLFRTAEHRAKHGLLDGVREAFWLDEQRQRALPSMLPEALHPVRQPLLCVLPNSMAPYVVRAEGWDYGADDRGRKKYGYISHYGTAAQENHQEQPAPMAEGSAGAGSDSAAVPQPPELQLVLDLGRVAGAAAAAATAGGNGTKGQGHGSFVFLLAYLASYEHMGVATMACSGGCTCGGVRIKAAITERISITKVSQG